jgi:two-component system chemotaxis sensor kinase CheA
MTRLVRDSAQKLGKNAELILRGEETEIDKTEIEQLSDPLVHMLRNAVDHGLEPTEERRRAGKPVPGRILLRAVQEGDEVCITVRDDGRGLDPDRLLRKGIERGLVRGNGAGMSREEIFQLIFEPGFSTAQAVTNVSGRGVGMDVVKRNVELLKGRIEIASTLGQGTAMTIRLPLTLAIIEGMRVRVGESQYAIPMAAIREAVRVPSSAVTRTIEGQELALIRGNLYPVLRLHETHGIAPDHAEPWEGMLVLLGHQNRAFAVLVDELLGHQQTVVKGLSPYLGPVPGVSGCSILGDGNVSLILDVGDLAARVQAAPKSSAPPAAMGAPTHEETDGTRGRLAG